MKQQLAIVQKIYFEKTLTVIHSIQKWFLHKLEAFELRNNFQKCVLKHIETINEKNTISFKRINKILSDERSFESNNNVSSFTRYFSQRQITLNPSPKKNNPEYKQFMERLVSCFNKEVENHKKLLGSSLKYLSSNRKKIEDFSQEQKKLLVCSEKAKKQFQKYQTVKNNSYSYKDIINLKYLIDKEIRLRVNFVNDTLEYMNKLVCQQKKIYNELKENLQNFEANFDDIWSANYLYEALAKQVKKMSNQNEIKSKYFDIQKDKYTSDYLTLAKSNATTVMQQFNCTKKQKLQQLSGFTEIYQLYFNQMITRIWKLDIATNFIVQSWKSCTGILTIQGFFFIINNQNDIIAQNHLKFITIQKEDDNQIKLTYEQQIKGIFKSLKSSSKVCLRLKFLTEEQLQELQLHILKWRN